MRRDVYHALDPARISPTAEEISRRRASRRTGHHRMAPITAASCFSASSRRCSI
jgi:hypothetical protein